MSLYHRFLLDTQRDYSFAGYLTNITTYVIKANWQFGVIAVNDCIGNSAYMELILSNAGGEFTLDDTSALYYGKIRTGTLIRVQMSQNNSTWTNMATLKIREINPNYSMDGAHSLTIKASDILQDFLNQDYIPPLQTNIRVDNALRALHNTRAAIWPYESYYQFIGHTSIGDGKAPFYGADWVDFETAETTLDYLGDNLGKEQKLVVQQYIRSCVEAEIFGLYYFSPRSEKFEFLSRYHAADTAVSWNVTEAITGIPKFTYGRDFVNDYALGYFPRDVGTANSVLWQSDNVPFSIPARSTKRLTIKYRDPNNESASVGALLVNDPVKGTDIIFNTLSDGSGAANLNDKIDITLIKGAASSELIISNLRRRDQTWITFLRITGTPITAYNKEIAYGYNDGSLFGSGSDETSGNDRKSGSDTLAAISDPDFAQSYADFRVNVFGQPQQVIEKITIPIKDTDTVTQAQVLTRTIGDVINVTISVLDHNTDYMIVGEMHSVTGANERQHTVSYLLRPTNTSALFILDTSNSNAGDTLSF